MPKKICNDGCGCDKCKTTTKKKKTKSKPKKAKIAREIIKSIMPNMRLMTFQPDYTIQNIPSQFNTPKDILDIKNSLVELLQKEKKKLSGVISTQTEDMHEIVDDMATEKAINSIGKRNNNEYLKQSLNAWSSKIDASLKQSSNKKPAEVKGVSFVPDTEYFQSFIPDAEYFQSFNTSVKKMVDDMSIPPHEHIVRKTNSDEIFGYDEYKDVVIEAKGGGYKRPEMAEATDDYDEMPGLIDNEDDDDFFDTIEEPTNQPVIPSFSSIQNPLTTRDVNDFTSKSGFNMSSLDEEVLSLPKIYPDLITQKTAEELHENQMKMTSVVSKPIETADSIQVADKSVVKPKKVYVKSTTQFEKEKQTQIQKEMKAQQKKENPPIRGRPKVFIPERNENDESVRPDGDYRHTHTTPDKAWINRK